MTKIQTWLAKSKMKIMAFALVVIAGAMGATNAFAAVDPDVASTTGQMVTTMKENVTGVITTNISQIVIVGVIIFSLTFIWKLARRFMK